eukprot:TRINITY_DN1794_c0_g1_i2.p1 TRINITY_DN1794_c0_g1~~TRINITY_DN1794_c0_g1_i2.p1  ORF type:complete len:167 (-),score=43.04 TRINITY_DN1794_c0_g1_i2:83-541(-)
MSKKSLTAAVLESTNEYLATKGKQPLSSTLVGHITDTVFANVRKVLIDEGRLAYPGFGRLSLRKPEAGATGRTIRYYVAEIDGKTRARLLKADEMAPNGLRVHTKTPPAKARASFRLATNFFGDAKPKTRQPRAAAGAKRSRATKKEKSEAK